MKTYVLTVSEKFPKTHEKAGKETRFIDKIINKQKIHTIRSNYPLWRKRFEEIENGKACLSVRVWEGTPYKSKQKEVFRFYKTDVIGFQRLEFYNQQEKVYIYDTWVNDRFQFIHDIAQNDGLDIEDFTDWFKNHDLSEPLAIIHFTNFRY